MLGQRDRSIGNELGEEASPTDSNVVSSSAREEDDACEDASPSGGDVDYFFVFGFDGNAFDVDAKELEMRYKALQKVGAMAGIC